MDNLLIRWRAITDKLNAPKSLVEHGYHDIKKAYSGVNRHYHTLSHLAFMFAEVDREDIKDDGIEFAIWYHDLVYRAGSASNERKSADIASHALTNLGLPQNKIIKIKQMIMATKDHVCEPGDKATALFLDIDMSILGAQSTIYQHYSDSIRKEMFWLPLALYRKARLDFLRSLEYRDTLFLTEIFQQRYEKQARKNIAEEQDFLRR